MLLDAIHFINRTKEKYLNNSTRVLYIGDRLTEYGYLFELKDLDKILICILDIPQHHYIFLKDVNGAYVYRLKTI